MSPIKIYKGYSIYEDFEAGALFSDWTNGGSGAAVTLLEGVSGNGDKYSTQIDGSSKTLSKGISSTSSKSVFQYSFFINTKKDGMSAEIKSGSTTAVIITTNNGNICYVNSSGTNVTLWSNYKGMAWYNIKVIQNPATDTADIYVNGKLKATSASFRNTVSSVDTIVFSTPTSNTSTYWLDDVKFYTYQSLPGDYAPTPAPKTSTHNVGISSFPGFRTGYHVGWDYPYAFPTHDLYMGTYDEGTPETVDWEIKYWSEHGIDFFMECTNGTFSKNIYRPWKTPFTGHQLEGFFDSQYKSNMKFCIQEVSGYDSTYFRYIVIPYWIEHYFKDEKYLVIDNKPVIAFVSPEGLTAALAGGGTTVADEFAYLRSALQSEGFSGAYIIGCYYGNTEPTAAGYNPDLSQSKVNGLQSDTYDAIYAYSYMSHTVSIIEDTMSDMDAFCDAAGTIKCLGVGSVGWNTEAMNHPNASDGFLTASEFGTLNSWLNNTFMPAQSGLATDVVIMDSWSEYGEGHWIAPGTLAGFGYLDAIRTAFTSGGAHSDPSPTSSQKKRMNRYFPKSWIGHTWNFDSTFSDTEGWSVVSNVSNLATSNGYMNGTITATTAALTCRDLLGIDGTTNKYIKVKFKNSSNSTVAKVYFVTDADSTWDETKSKTCTINANDSNYTEYTFDMSAVSGWSGNTIRKIRFDPEHTGASSGSFSIDYIIVTDE